MIKIGLKQEEYSQLNFGIKFSGRWVFFLLCGGSFNFEGWDWLLLQNWLYLRFKCDYILCRSFLGV